LSEPDDSLRAVEPEDIVQRQVDAFNAHDVEGFLATYAEDAVAQGADGMDTPVQGRDALRAHYTRRLAQPGLRATIEQRVRLGPWVVDYEIVENDAGSTPALAVYEVEGSLIQRTTIVRGQTQPHN
jgi:uncharacterized protein (TIGR02246 family)